MLIPVAYIKKLSFDSVINIELNVLRGILGFFGFAIFIYSFTILPLIDVVVISWSTPIFTFILSSIILKEKPSKKVVFACIISILQWSLCFLIRLIFA
jgi:drug/metabolite transporter (DMT)-like permease